VCGVGIRGGGGSADRTSRGLRDAAAEPGRARATRGCWGGIREAPFGSGVEEEGKEPGGGLGIGKEREEHRCGGALGVHARHSNRNGNR
jgi:hypothetical protein